MCLCLFSCHSNGVICGGTGKMYGHAIVPLCLPSVMQSLLFSNKMAFNLFTVFVTSSKHKNQPFIFFDLVA